MLKKKVLEAMRSEVSTAADTFLFSSCMAIKVSPDQLEKKHLAILADVIGEKFTKFFNPQVGQRIKMKIRAL